MSAALEIKNLSLQILDKNIFSNLSLQHKQGDVALWYGPSGCGKSSLAKAISGRLDFFTGEIRFLNQNVAGYDLNRFYVGHENDLFGWQTLQEHIDFLTANVKLEMDNSEIQNFLNILEIDSKLHRYPKGLSMGEIRRVQILRSLILKSRLVIFDETFSALDIQLKNRILPKLVEIWKRHQTNVIIISHESEKDFNISLDQLLDFGSLTSKA